MSVPFQASEARILSFLDSIKSGRAIDNGRPWSLLDLLTLAGCVHAAILSHPPAWVSELAALDDEKREAVEDTHEREVTSVTQFLSRVAIDAVDGHFGRNLPDDVGDEVRGVLALNASGDVCVQMCKRGDEG